MADEHTDIVERLKKRAAAFGVPKVSSISTTGSLIFEAAEEITKLRGLLGEVLDCIDSDDYLTLTMLFPHLSQEYQR